MKPLIKTDSKTGITYITLTNKKLTATFLNFGARWHQFLVPDHEDKQENILLSLDTPEMILQDQAQFGALVGPVAGRIKNAMWQDISLDKNLGDHHIHGGSQGWWCQFWDYNLIDESTVSFTLIDTISGYPGPIKVVNTYELTKTSVIMTTEVTSESETIINPTNHVYFNLSGNAKREISNHELQILSSSILETDQMNIPTGNILPVKNTGFDFNETKNISQSITQIGKGIDDAYLLEEKNPQIILSDVLSGRQLSISSNREAAVIFSTTDFNDDFMVNGQKMRSELGIAIETQELPDIINHPEWGSIELPMNTTKKFQTTYTVSLLEKAI